MFFIHPVHRHRHFTTVADFFVRSREAHALPFSILHFLHYISRSHPDVKSLNHSPANSKSAIAAPLRYNIPSSHIAMQIQLIYLLYRPASTKTRWNHFASQVWKLAHDEYQELWLLLHLTRDRSPFEGHEGVMKRIKFVRTELGLALERWKVLTEVDGGQVAAGAEACRCLGGFGGLDSVFITLV